MAQEEAELVSLSGSPIYRHEAPEPGFHPPTDAARFLDEISDHLEQHLGPIEAVFHEIISEFAHIDVHWIPPNPKRPCHTLVSSGMSDAEMTLPDGVEVTPFAELFITLPPTWSISEEAFRDEANYWPLRLLKTLARLPATYNTWLGFGHTVPNGDPAEPYDDSTELCGAIVLPSPTTSPEFDSLTTKTGEVIEFYSVVPIHLDEMNYKLRDGAESLAHRLHEKCAPDFDLLRSDRSSVCRRPWWNPFS